jgi:hypothetical protein
MCCSVWLFQAREKRPGSICSFIAVVYHVSYMLHDEQEMFVDRSVHEILPWCMAQHFSVRLYAQVRIILSVFMFLLCYRLTNILSRISGLAWLKRQVLDLMIKFIRPLYNLLQHFANHYLRLDTFDLWLPTELNCQLFWSSRYIASGQTSHKTC